MKASMNQILIAFISFLFVTDYLAERYPHQKYDDNFIPGTDKRD